MGNVIYPTAPASNDIRLTLDGSQDRIPGLKPGRGGWWGIREHWTRSDGVQIMQPNLGLAAAQPEHVLGAVGGDLKIVSLIGAPEVTCQITPGNWFARTHGDGYQVLVINTAAGDWELWYVEPDCSTTQAGIFPPAPGDLSTGRDPVIDAQGRLYTMHSRGRADVILQRTVAGVVDIVYDEATNPLVRLHGAYMTVGP